MELRPEPISRIVNTYAARVRVPGVDRPTTPAGWGMVVVGPCASACQLFGLQLTCAYCWADDLHPRWLPYIEGSVLAGSVSVGVWGLAGPVASPRSGGPGRCHLSGQG
jgi:hypothetical protein